MNSIALWEKLKNTCDIVQKGAEEFIFPANLTIKNKGTIKYLKKSLNGDIIIKCTSSKKLKMTNDHIMTLTNGNDVRAENLKIGNTIFGGCNGKSTYMVSHIRNYKKEDFSYDVTTESAHFMVNDIYSHNCRSFLSAVWVEKEYDISEKFYWVYNTDNKKDYPYGTFVSPASFEEVPNGKYKEGKYAINFRGNTGWLLERKDDKVIIKEPKVYGRFNEGVITLNLAHVGLSAAEEYKNRKLEYANATEMGVEIPEPNLNDIFYKILDERLEICHAALLTRHESVSNILAKNSPILWMYGGLARLDPEASIGDLIKSHKDHSETSISLGYAGLYETCMAIIEKSNTTKEGKKFSKEVLKHMNDVMNNWKAEDNLGYSIYGTPEESLTYKFALANRRDFGLIEHITDKDYVVNSYHVDPREEISAWNKLSTEGEYLALSPGGAVSYIETGDLRNNYKAIVAVMQYMYEHILYAEVNTTMGVCYECNYKGFFKLTKNIKFTFTCPKCGNNDDDKMSVKGRVCGYLGELVAGNTNPGRLDDYIHRVFHLM